MTPLIKDGDVLTVVPVSSAPPQMGHVVAFIHPATGKLVVHRVVGLKGARYLLKGDRALEGDGWVPRENILGCVKKVERQRKKVFP